MKDAMDSTTDTTPASPEALRAQMIAKIQKRGYGIPR
jgi:hypothetical protein